MKVRFRSWPLRATAIALVLMLGLSMIGPAAARASNEERGQNVFVYVDGELCPVHAEKKQGVTFLQIRAIANCLQGAQYWHDYSAGAAVLTYGPFYVQIFTEAWTGKRSQLWVYTGSPVNDPNPKVYDIGPKFASYESADYYMANMVATRPVMDAIGIYVTWDGSTVRISSGDNAIPPANWATWLPSHSDYPVVDGALRELPSVTRLKSCLNDRGAAIVKEFKDKGYDAWIDWNLLAVQVNYQGMRMHTYYCNDYVPNGGYFITWHTVGSAREVSGALTKTANNVETWGDVAAYGSGLVGLAEIATKYLVGGAVTTTASIFAFTYKKMYLKTMRDSAATISACADAAEKQAVTDGVPANEMKNLRVGLVLYGPGANDVTIACVPRLLTNSQITITGQYYE